MMVTMGAASRRNSSSSGLGSSSGSSNIIKRPVGRPRKSVPSPSMDIDHSTPLPRSRSTIDATANGSMRSSRNGRKTHSLARKDEQEEGVASQIGEQSTPVRRQTSQRKSTTGSSSNHLTKRRRSQTVNETKKRGRKSKGDDKETNKAGTKLVAALNELQNPNGELSNEEEDQRRIEEENLLMERWKEEYFEVVEQLPLELRRTYTLMRELETKFQDKIDLIASQAEAYRDARIAYKNLTPEQKAIQAKIQQKLERQQQFHEKQTASEQGDETVLPTTIEDDGILSSDADGECEDDAEVYHELSGEVMKVETTPSESIVQSSERVSEEIGEVRSPSDQAMSTDVAIDSPISSTTFETLAQLAPTKAARLSLLAGITRASSESIRIAEEKVGLAVTAYEWVDRQIRRLDADLQKSENTLLLGLRAGTEASRGLQDALGIDYANGQSAHRWDDVEALLMGRSTRKSSSAIPKTKARQLSTSEHDEEGKESRESILSGVTTTEMAIDPNEPTYCYCDEVSSGEMIACDHEDCPREWFHLTCVGFEQPPKGKWFCLFCAPLYGFKGSGTFPDNSPCLPSHLQSSSSYGKSRKRKKGSVSIPTNSNKQKRR